MTLFPFDVQLLPLSRLFSSGPVSFLPYAPFSAQSDFNFTLSPFFQLIFFSETFFFLELSALPFGTFSQSVLLILVN